MIFQCAHGMRIKQWKVQNVLFALMISNQPLPRINYVTVFHAHRKRMDV